MATPVSGPIRGLIPRGLESQISDVKIRADRAQKIAEGNDVKMKAALEEFADLRERVRELEAEAVRRRGGRPPKVA